MTEPAVTLSDYLLAVEAMIFAVLLWRADAAEPGMRRWWLVFFASVAAAAVFGGTVHGFFHDASEFGHSVLWTTTLLSIGVTALATWAIGAELLASPRLARDLLIAAAVQVAVYGVAVIFLNHAFWMAIAISLPAALFLLIALAWGRRGDHGLRITLAAAVMLNLIGAALQQLRVGVHTVYFDHNVLYHVLQAIVLGLMFWGAWRLIDAAPR
jgi:hypothetical protein